MSAAVVCRARRVLSREPAGWRVIDGGSVRIEDGTVAAVGTEVDVTGAERRDLGDTILTCGLVNAHTHLELSRAPFPEGEIDYLGFLGRMKDYRSNLGPDVLADATRQGLRESLAAGTTAAIDLVTDGEAAAAWRESPLGGVLCAEILGLSPDRLSGARQALEAVREERREGLEAGLFLHTPFTVAEELRTWARTEAETSGERVAIHLLESADEMDLLTRGEGRLAAWLAELGVLERVPRVSSPEKVMEQFAQAGDTLVHLASLPASLAPLLPPDVTAVLCPRSNRTLGVGPAPVDALRRAGVTLALGTDSRASSPDLDLRAEMRAACDIYLISPRDALEMATHGGASALGDPTRDGLRKGARADLLVLGDPGSRDPWESLLLPDATVREVWIGGQAAWPA